MSNDAEEVEVLADLVFKASGGESGSWDVARAVLAAGWRREQTGLAEASDDDLLRAVRSMGSHVDHFSAWFEDGKRVRFEDVGGIQCTCGWSHPPIEGIRPWAEFHAHWLKCGLAALLGASTTRDADRG